MSNIYVTEPPTSGRLLLRTSKGDIEVELWSRECPRACRNIIALALEGYYDGLVFHRVVPGFCVQTGDPSGTGTGGESVYGEPFEDEVHQRLRFNRRGLLAMANPGERDSNESQFFFTLDATPELQNKHTLFGRVAGATIYNLLALAEVELREDEPDRPVYPPKLLSVDVLDDPFPDIVPRITRQEKREQEAARRAARQEARRAGGAKREKVKKNTGLLSFGEAEEVPESEDGARFKKGGISSHDLLKNDKRLRREAASPSASVSASPAPAAATGHQERIAPPSPPAPAPAPVPEKKDKDKKKRKAQLEPDVDDVLAAESTDAQRQIRELEESIRGLAKRPRAPGEGRGDKEPSEADKVRRRGKALLEEARRKYVAAAASGSSASAAAAASARRGDSTTAKERETMEMLRRFQAAGSARSRSRKDKDKGGDGDSGRSMREPNRTDHAEAAAPAADAASEPELEPGMREYGASDSDSDSDSEDAASTWRSHAFAAASASASASKGGAGGADAAYEPAEDDYVTLDPRDTSGKAAAGMGFGGGKAGAKAGAGRAREGEGRRGRDWVERDREGGRGSAWDGQQARERQRDGRRGGGDKYRGERGRERDRNKEDARRDGYSGEKRRDRDRDRDDEGPLRARDVERW